MQLWIKRSIASWRRSIRRSQRWLRLIIVKKLAWLINVEGRYYRQNWKEEPPYWNRSKNLSIQLRMPWIRPNICTSIHWPTQDGGLGKGRSLFSLMNQLCWAIQCWTLPVQLHWMQWPAIWSTRESGSKKISRQWGRGKVALCSVHPGWTWPIPAHYKSWKRSYTWTRSTDPESSLKLSTLLRD